MRDARGLFFQEMRPAQDDILSQYAVDPLESESPEDVHSHGMLMSWQDQ